MLDMLIASLAGQNGVNAATLDPNHPPESDWFQRAGTIASLNLLRLHDEGSREERLEEEDGGGIFVEERGPENEDDVAEFFGDFESEKGDDGKDEAPPEPVEAEGGTTRARRIRHPGQPSRKEFEDYNFTHVGFRDWCEVCTRGRGRKDQHR